MNESEDQSEQIIIQKIFEANDDKELKEKIQQNQKLINNFNKDLKQILSSNYEKLLDCKILVQKIEQLSLNINKVVGCTLAHLTNEQLVQQNQHRNNKENLTFQKQQLVNTIIKDICNKSEITDFQSIFSIVVVEQYVYSNNLIIPNRNSQEMMKGILIQQLQQIIQFNNHQYQKLIENFYSIFLMFAKMSQIQDFTFLQMAMPAQFQNCIHIEFLPQQNEISEIFEKLIKFLIFQSFQQLQIASNTKDENSLKFLKLCFKLVYMLNSSNIQQLFYKCSQIFDQTFVDFNNNFEKLEDLKNFISLKEYNSSNLIYKDMNQIQNNIIEKIEQEIVDFFAHKLNDEIIYNILNEIMLNILKQNNAKPYKYINIWLELVSHKLLSNNFQNIINYAKKFINFNQILFNVYTQSIKLGLLELFSEIQQLQCTIQNMSSQTCANLKKNKGSHKIILQLGLQKSIMNIQKNFQNLFKEIQEFLNQLQGEQIKKNNNFFDVYNVVSQELSSLIVDNNNNYKNQKQQGLLVLLCQFYLNLFCQNSIMEQKNQFDNFEELHDILCQRFKSNKKIILQIIINIILKNKENQNFSEFKQMCIKFNQKLIIFSQFKFNSDLIQEINNELVIWLINYNSDQKYNEQIFLILKYFIWNKLNVEKKVKNLDDIINGIILSQQQKDQIGSFIQNNFSNLYYLMNFDNSKQQQFKYSIQQNVHDVQQMKQMISNFELIEKNKDLNNIIFENSENIQLIGIQGFVFDNMACVKRVKKEQQERKLKTIQLQETIQQNQKSQTYFQGFSQSIMKEFQQQKQTFSQLFNSIQQK